MREISKEECEKHCKKRLWRKILACLCVLVLLVLLTIFIIWLVLRPTKPRFVLQDASFFDLNLSATSKPYQLTTKLQPTLGSRNPNSRIGVYYERIHVYATYKSHQITLATHVPPSYQGHHDNSFWSPILHGPSIPVPPELCWSLAQDQKAGFMLLHVKVSAKVRWKVGTWISGIYHLDVTCPAFLSTSATSPPTEFRFLRRTRCSVDV